MQNLRLLFAFLGILLFANSAVAETVYLDGKNISFEIPAGFTPLSKEEIAIKYPSARAPKYVIGNETAGTTIAYDIKPDNISDLDGFKSYMTHMFPKMVPGLVWKENKIITLSGKRWLYMEITSKAINADIYNIMLFTDYNGQMLVFNFNSTKEEFPKYEKSLRASLASISLNN
jgi:hypothetical protein